MTFHDCSAENCLFLVQGCASGIAAPEIFETSFCIAGEVVYK